MAKKKSSRDKKKRKGDGYRISLGYDSVCQCYVLYRRGQTICLAGEDRKEARANAVAVIESGNYF